MIQLLFTVLGAEAAAVVLLLVKTPMRRLVVWGLDRIKRGKGPLVVKTVAGTVVVVLVSSVHSMEKIRRRSGEGGAMDDTDRVVWSAHLLEASLMGYSLFLALVIDRLHHYIREFQALKKTEEALMMQIKRREDGNSNELKSRDKKIAGLKRRITELESEYTAKTQSTEDAKAKIMAMKKQSEGFHVEYENLLEDNWSLQDQLQTIAQIYSRPERNKDL